MQIITNQFKPSKSRAYEIENCSLKYKNIEMNISNLENNSYPEIDPSFVSCIFSVHPNNFFKNEKLFKFYIKYSAYQIVNVALKTKTSANEALKKMQEFKDSKKTYYRFVNYDLPEPGTGMPIYGWIKTKERNIGCINEVKQHYQNNPIVDEFRRN